MQTSSPRFEIERWGEGERAGRVQGGSAVRRGPIDGRTLRKLRRYREELRKGAAGGERDLLPFEVVVRANFLLEHGESMDQLRKLVRPRSRDYDERRMIKLLDEMQQICRFRPEAYEIAGVSRKTLVEAGLVEEAA